MPVGRKSSSGSRRRARQNAAQPPEAPALWLFLCDPGLGPLFTRELKHRDVLRQKARPKRFYLRNADVLILPQSQVSLDFSQLRIAQDVLACHVFGRGQITEANLDWLAAAWRREKVDGLISSVAGSTFRREEVLRMLSTRLKARGIDIDKVAEPQSPAQLLIIDDAFYFGFNRFNYQDGAGRKPVSQRPGSLPPTVGAAMVFAAKPESHEVVWDPMVGSGTLLREVMALCPDAELIGCDIDPAALEMAKSALGKRKGLELIHADVRKLDLQRTDVSLSLANLLFGPQLNEDVLLPEFYEAMLQRLLANAAPNWRGVFITSDEAALALAVDEIGGLAREHITKTRVRGEEASITLIKRR